MPTCGVGYAFGVGIGIKLTNILLRLVLKGKTYRSMCAAANKSLVGDPKSGTFSRLLPCVGELVFIVWSGAGRHNSTVRRLVEKFYKLPVKPPWFSVHLSLHSKLFFGVKGKEGKEN